jgi:hypothetical protein
VRLCKALRTGASWYDSVARRAGSPESGVGTRESGVGSRESGLGSRDSGVGSRESGLESGVWTRESGLGTRVGTNSGNSTGMLEFREFSRIGFPRIPNSKKLEFSRIPGIPGIPGTKTRPCGHPETGNRKNPFFFRSQGTVPECCCGKCHRRISSR